MTKKITLYIIPLLILFSCKKEKVPESFKPSNAHEAYLHSLEQVNLLQTALGIDWESAAGRSLTEPVSITLPFEEVFVWDPTTAEAIGYRFFVRRGLRVEADVSVNSSDSLLLFTDLFREIGDSIMDWVHVATADSTRRLEFEPRQDAYYVLRLQPELLRGGRFSVIIREVPSIGFPVPGKSSRDIQSFFGAPRDGGSREHHGVDIFAARHTPVVAPSNSVVRRVGTGEIGGKYVWLRDSERSLNLYFAHLETQEVTRDTRVEAGQIIGTVGNSGNARTTAPHLHFGIYSRGPIDPLYFIKETDSVPDKISGDTIFLNELVQLNTASSIRSSTDISSEPFATLEKNSTMKVKGLAGNFYRVLLSDNTTGYIPVHQVELIRNPEEREMIAEDLALSNIPDKNTAGFTEISN
jgi:murein DD-endopeptidase MepM/ murein hydrolase activator NlpD